MRVGEATTIGDAIRPANRVVSEAVDLADRLAGLGRRVADQVARAVLVGAAFPLSELLEALNQLVCGRESALPVALALTGGFLVALVHGAPLARAGDVHALFDAKLAAASTADAGASSRFLAIPLMPDACPGAGGFTRTNVAAAIRAADRFVLGGTSAGRRARNTPVRDGFIRGELSSPFAGWGARRHTRVTDEAIGQRLAVHGIVASTAVLGFVPPFGCFFERVRVAIGAANERVGARRFPGPATTPKAKHDSDVG
jgi:hypothetical protein